MILTTKMTDALYVKERWRVKGLRRLERDRLRYRRDKEDPEKMEAMCARKQIAICCKACGCYIRKCQGGGNKWTAKHIRNGGPEMEEEERKNERGGRGRKRKEGGEKEVGRGRGKNYD